MSATEPQRMAAPASGTLVPAPAPVSLARRAQSLRDVVTRVWLPRASWSVGRTGRTGLAGIALLLASAIFYVSTELPVTEDIAQQRADLKAAAAHPAVAPAQNAVADSLQDLRRLPGRNDVPEVLGQLLQQADDAQLSIDTAKYEISATKAGSLVRYRLAFPVDGPYPQIRKFIDAVLSGMPAVAVNEIAISRKSIGDEMVEAQLRMTIFTRGTP